MGYLIRPCRTKFNGSRLSNPRKIKRFREIICSPKCKNTIRELKDLSYQKDSSGKTVYDKFNIDPHTLNHSTLGVYKPMEKRESLRWYPERKCIAG